MKIPFVFAINWSLIPRLPIALALVSLTACGGAPVPDVIDTPDQGESITLDIRADVNRDGVINKLDDEHAEQISVGAIVLPNLDDDGQRCAQFQVVNQLGVVETSAFIECSDASDAVSNGPEDVEDLTLLQIVKWASVPESASVKIFTQAAVGEDRFRLLILRGDTYRDVTESPLTLDDLRGGALLAVESKDIIRDTREWDGKATLRVEVSSNNGLVFDELPLVVAPLITQHELGLASDIIMAVPPTVDSARFFRKMSDSQTVKAAAESPASKTEPKLFKSINSIKAIAINNGVVDFSAVNSQFMDDIMLASLETKPNIINLDYDNNDIWAQDFFESAFVSRPQGNGFHTMRIMLRSANAEQTRFGGITFRAAGVALYSKLRGPGVGVVQIEARYLDPVGSQYGETFNSTGNFTTTPPYTTRSTGYPQGRMVYGSSPNPRFITLLASQGLQPPINLDTRWLAVGHVDEFISFLPANNRRGWVMAIADPELAYTILQDARNRAGGDSRVFSGLLSAEYLFGEVSSENASAERTLDQILSDTALRAANDFAITYIYEALEILKAELELSDDEIVYIPVLYRTYQLTNVWSDSSQPPRAVSAYFPGAINGLYLGQNTFISPKQYGPVVDGEDVLEKAVAAALAPHGISVNWVDDFYYSHIGEGEVHCVTNAYRNLDDVAVWWQ